MMTTVQIRQELARAFCGGSLAESVARLLVLYDAYQELERLVNSYWRVGYDDEVVGLYLVRVDGLRTRSLYADSETQLVVMLLDEMEKVEFHAGALGDEEDYQPVAVTRGW